MSLADLIASGWEPFVDRAGAEPDSRTDPITHGQHSELLAAALEGLSEVPREGSMDDRPSAGGEDEIAEVLTVLLAKHVQDALFALECRAWRAALAGLPEFQLAAAEASIWAGTHSREQCRSAIAAPQGAPWVDRLGGLVLEREWCPIDLPVFGLDDVSGGRRGAFAIPAGAIWSGAGTIDSPRVGEAVLVADVEPVRGAEVR